MEGSSKSLFVDFCLLVDQSELLYMIGTSPGPCYMHDIPLAKIVIRRPLSTAGKVTVIG